MSYTHRDQKLFGSSSMIGILNDGFTLDSETYSSPIDVWRAMMDLPPLQDISDAPQIFWGTLLEEPIRRSFEIHNGLTLIRDHTFNSPIFPRFCDTPDGHIMSKDQSLTFEAKNIDLSKQFQWSAGVIDLYKVQCQWHIKLFNEVAENIGFKIVDGCHLRVLFGGRSHQDYFVDKDDNFIKDISDVAEDFVKNYVDTGIEPPLDASKAYGSHLGLKYPAKENRAKEKKIVNDDGCYKSAKAIHEISQEMKVLEKEKQYHTNYLIEQTGNNYGITIPGFGTFLNYDVSGRVNPHKVIELIKERQLIELKTISKLEDECRGNPYRVPRVYPSKKSL